MAQREWNPAEMRQLATCGSSASDFAVSMLGIICGATILVACETSSVWSGYAGDIAPPPSGEHSSGASVWLVLA
jgi:hypothetical protein